MNRTAIDLARVTIELTSPLTLGCGDRDDLVDSPFVTDSSGLPAIPGTSIVGVLRSRWAEFEDPPMSENDLFGYEGRQRDERAAGSASRLDISWARVHDSENRPAKSRMLPEEVSADPLLNQAADALVRQHVRISARGGAHSAGRGLFDEALVAAGHRFTFEVQVQDAQDAVLDLVLAVLADPATRIGGKTRRGMGGFEVKEVRRRRFDLCNDVDFKAFSTLARDLAEQDSNGMLGLFDATRPIVSEDTVFAELQIRPRGTWRFGGGTPREADVPREVREAHGDRVNLPDSVPFREPAVFWTASSGRLSTHAPRLVVPATGLKGAIRHRVRFHAFAMRGVFADGATVDTGFVEGIDLGLCPEPEEVVELFGRVPLADAGPEETAKAGSVIIDDLTLAEAPETLWFDHLSVDRFSGGPLEGHLFNEVALWSAPESSIWKLRVCVRGARKVSATARRALQRTLEDLTCGRLQVGAGSGRGHGWLEGELHWSDGDWPAGAPSRVVSEGSDGLG